ncbi:glutathione-disulfide reductase, partial [Streptococcus anginosus]|nr:glutathione-disulfide reductase [Streptococcus anginosus]
ETLHKYSSGYGFEVNNLNFDFTTLKANRDAYVQRSRQSYAANFERNGVEKIDGFARFIDNHTIEVNGQQYKAPHITIATGGH